MKPIRVFNYTLHKELWNWLADNPLEDKENWPGWEKYGIDLKEYSDCFACFCADKGPTPELEFHKCVHCPLDWPNGFCFPRHAQVTDAEYFFEEWVKAIDDYDGQNDDYDRQNVEYYARKIANLPIKESDNFVTVVI